MSNISGSDRRIDVSDVTDRIEELETEIDTMEDETELADLVAEHEMLKALLSDCEGGGDHDWRGEWYYGYLINENDFENHARELADDIGAIDSKSFWPNNCIDWEKAAGELKQDYTTIEFDGGTFYARG